ncbi:phage major capsid protein, P2 family [Pasteurella multocida]|nr:phage major capsid protein, P2 family [Pasteurella multocida]
MKTEKEFYLLIEKLNRKYASSTQNYKYKNKNNFTIDNDQVFKIRESIKKHSTFLQSINTYTVFDNDGNKLSCSSKKITGRKEGSRNIAKMEHDNYRYELFEMDSGVLIPWHLLDHFALYKEQQEARYEEYIQKQIALDMLQIAWHGQSIAPNTTADDLSDVNKGWIQSLAEQRSRGFLTEGSKKTGTIKVFGENADYSNLDQLALELRQAIDYRHQQRNDLVFLVGYELVAKENTPIFQQAGIAHKNALSPHYLANNFGGMPTIIPPNFPKKKVQ